MSKFKKLILENRSVYWLMWKADTLHRELRLINNELLRRQETSNQPRERL